MHVCVPFWFQEVIMVASMVSTISSSKSYDVHEMQYGHYGGFLDGNIHPQTSYNVSAHATILHVYNVIQLSA